MITVLNVKRNSSEYFMSVFIEAQNKPLNGKGEIP